MSVVKKISRYQCKLCGKQITNFGFPRQGAGGYCKNNPVKFHIWEKAD